MATVMLDSPADITPEEVEKHQSDNPESLSANFVGNDRRELLPAFATVVALYLVNHIYGSMDGFIAVAVALGLWWRWSMGRTYKLVWWEIVDLWILLKYGLIYEADPRRAARVKAAVHSPPFPIELYEIRGSPAGNIGLAFNPKTRQDTMVIEVDGSELVSQNFGPMEESLAHLAGAIKKIVSVGGSNVGVAFVAHRRPMNKWRISRSYAGTLHPDIAFPRVLRENIPEDQWTERDHRLMAYHRINMVELPKSIMKVGKEFPMAMVLTIQRPRKSPFQAKKGSKSQRGADKIRRSAAIKVAQTAMDELRRLKVDNPRVLDLAGLQGYFRTLWDVRETQSYYDWAERADQQAILDSELHWPQKSIRAFRDHMVIDEADGSEPEGSYHAHILLTGHPPKSLPNFILNIWGVPQDKVPYMSFSSVGVPVTYKFQYEALKRGSRFREEGFRLLGYEGSHPEMEMTAERIRKKQWTLALSRFADKRALLVTISHTSERRLEEAVDEAIRHFGLNGLKPKLVKRRCRQKPALLTAAGIPML